VDKVEAVVEGNGNVNDRCKIFPFWDVDDDEDEDGEVTDKGGDALDDVFLVLLDAWL
jgi:hypothetical protein